MKTIISYFWHLVFGDKKCIHMFKNSEVINLKIDPKCIFCKTPLSELSKDKKEKL